VFSHVTCNEVAVSKRHSSLAKVKILLMTKTLPLSLICPYGYINAFAQLFYVRILVSVYTGNERSRAGGS